MALVLEKKTLRQLEKTFLQTLLFLTGRTTTFQYYIVVVAISTFILSFTLRKTSK